MKHPALLGLFLATCVSAFSLPAAFAHSLNEQAVRQELQQKILLLRGRYACSSPRPCTLDFNRQGLLQNHVKSAPFSLSAVYVDSVKFSGTTLTVGAYGAIFIRLSNARPYQFKAFRLDHRKLQIRIAFDSSHLSELQKALHVIFASNVQQILNAEPPQQRKADLATLPLLTQESKAKASRELKQVIWPTIQPLQSIIKKGLTRPRPIYKPEPRYTDQARHDNVHGVCKLELIVNTQGFPQNIRVIRSLPDGLDERAIAAISQYRFRPSRTVKGEPIPVGMIVEVDFHLH